MNISKLWRRPRFWLIGSLALFILLAGLFFLLARPWQLALALESLNNLEASYNRQAPCHEPCLVKRLEYEANIRPALENNLPGLREEMEWRFKDDHRARVFRKTLERLLKTN